MDSEAFAADGIAGRVDNDSLQNEKCKMKNSKFKVSLETPFPFCILHFALCTLN
jgi:hypothetical protein